MAADSGGERMDELEYALEEGIEQYAQKRRVKAILEAQEKVGETHEIVFGGMLDQSISRQQGLAYLRRVIEHYINVVHPLMARYQSGSDYWENAVIGQIEIPRPDEVDRIEEDRDMVLVSDIPEQVTHEVVGLGSVLELPEVVTHTFEVTVKLPHRGVETKQYTQKKLVPESLLMSAYRITNQFLSEVDLDLDLQGGEKSVKSDPF